MTALLITVTPAKGFAVGLALIAVGMLLQYWLQLEVDCWRDRREQAAAADEDQAMRQGNSGAWVCAKCGLGSAEHATLPCIYDPVLQETPRRIPEQRVSPEGGAR